MADRHFVFDVDYGVEVADSRNHSRMRSLFLEARDLDNCGTKNFVIANQTADFSLPSALCKPPELMITQSWSARSYQGAAFTTASGGSFSPDTWSEIVGRNKQLFPYILASTFSSNPLGNPTAFAAGAWEFKGGVHVLESGDYIFRLSPPRVENVEDNCGVFFAKKGSGSVTIQVLDEYCIPKLVLSASSRFAYNITRFDASAVTKTALDVIFDDNLKDLDMTGLLAKALNPVTIVNEWRAIHATGSANITIPDAL
jgi:hypothetical protein